MDVFEFFCRRNGLSTSFLHCFAPFRSSDAMPIGNEGHWTHGFSSSAPIITSNATPTQTERTTASYPKLAG